MSSRPVRCFVAVDVSTPDITRGVRAIQEALRESGLVGRPVDPESLHITLLFIGEVEPHVIGELRDRLDGVRVSPMRLILRGVGYFPGGSRINTVWVGVEDAESRLTTIQREVVSRLSDLGFGPDKEFKPHVTILRVKWVRNKSEALSRIAQLSDHFVGEVAVEHIKLKKSTLTPTGPMYTDLHVVGLNRPPSGQP